jgi:hypothetical protein
MALLSTAVSEKSIDPPNSYPKVSTKRLRLEDLDIMRFYSSGFMLYAVSSLLANPFVIVKRRTQLGMDSSVRQIFLTEGMQGLFRGGSLCWVSGSNRMQYFTIYESAINILETFNTTSNIWQSVSRGVAGTNLKLKVIL